MGQTWIGQTSVDGASLVSMGRLGFEGLVSVLYDSKLYSPVTIVGFESLALNQLSDFWSNHVLLSL